MQANQDLYYVNDISDSSLFGASSLKFFGKKIAKIRLP